MSDIDRATLEREALERICSCWYYDLANDIDTCSDEDLKKIINNPMHLHYQNQKYNPVALKDFYEEVMNCTDVNC